MNDTLHQRLAALRQKHSEEKLAREKREERLAQNKPSGMLKDGKTSSSKKSSLAAEPVVGYMNPREMKRPGEDGDGGVGWLDGGEEIVDKEDDEKMIDGDGDGDRDRDVVNEGCDVGKEGPDRQNEKMEGILGPREKEKEKEKEREKEEISEKESVITGQSTFRVIPESDDADSDNETDNDDNGDEDDEDSRTPPLRKSANGADSFLYQGGNILSDAETTAVSEMAATSHDEHEQQRQREREEENSMEKRFLALASGIRKDQQSDGGVLGVKGQLSGADELKERFKRVFEGRYIAGSSTGAVRGGSEFSHDVGLEVEDEEEPDISVWAASLALTAGVLSLCTNNGTLCRN